MALSPLQNMTRIWPLLTILRDHQLLSFLDPSIGFLPGVPDITTAPPPKSMTITVVTAILSRCNSHQATSLLKPCFQSLQRSSRPRYDLTPPTYFSHLPPPFPPNSPGPGAGLFASPWLSKYTPSSGRLPGMLFHPQSTSLMPQLPSKFWSNGTFSRRCALTTLHTILR